MTSLAHVQMLEDKLSKKIVEIKESDEICESDVRDWMTSFRNEIGDEEVQELIVGTDPILMKEASNMIVEAFSPIKTVASKLLDKISKGLAEHYDKQG
jgi:hypothetical protein